MTIHIQRIAKRAGMTKRITPHLFRHSRITHLFQEGSSESAVKLMIWDSLCTDMLTTYTHLTGKDVDDEISRLYGLDLGLKKTETACLETVVCPACNLINPPGEDYCRGCMEALSEKAIADEDAVRHFVIKHKSTFRKYLERVDQITG